MSETYRQDPHPDVVDAKVNIAVLQARHDALQERLASIEGKQALINAKLDLVLDKLSEAKGGWRLLMGLGGAAATAGAIISWFATHTFTIGPR